MTHAGTKPSLTTLVAVILDTRATLIDEIIDRHDRFMGTLFSKAKRNHGDRLQQFRHGNQRPP